ncbi:MAG: MATE family efflux transporter [Ruminococcus sp.]
MNAKINFIEGNTKKCLASMVLPMMAAMILNMAYNLVDSLWIGNLLGETAYAALTNATPVILILSSVAMGATNGVSIILSQAVGANEKEKTDKLIMTSLTVAVLFSAGVTAVLEAALKPILILLNTPEEVLQLSYQYLSIYILGYLAVYLYCYFTAVLRSFGNSVFQVIAMLICTLLNAGLDPLFIHFMGFNGAAAATVLSQTLCLVFMLAYLHRKKYFKLRMTLFDKGMIVPFILKGIPSAFQQSIPAVSTSFLTSLVTEYGISALAAYGIAGKLETVLFYPAMAFNMTLTSIVGQCAGGRRYDRAGEYIKTSLIYGGAVLIILSAAVVGFSVPLSHLFVDSDGAAAIVSVYFRIVSIGYVLNMVSNCLLGSLNGMGKPSKSLFCMVLYYLVVRMPLARILSEGNMGINGIWTAVLISHIIAAAAAALAVKYEFARSVTE